MQAIKQLRKEIVEAMKNLMQLAKEKQTIGMLPICEDMITKTRLLLTLWDPGLIEEALGFIEDFKLISADDSGLGDDTNMSTGGLTSLALSPFKRITQQLTSLDLRSPDLDDFSTPCTPMNMEELWKTCVNQKSLEDDLLNTTANTKSSMLNMHETNFVLFPDCEDNLTDNETVNETSDNEIKCVEPDTGRMFLDTNEMCNSPSANYYKPTDEPEPWDLTQLNIEASVMCLVSKVKFLCGRRGSPAVRLRQNNKNTKKGIISHSKNKHNKESEVITQTVNSLTKIIKNGNKFTDGLDLNRIVDWVAELRPSMRKLRQAMDGLLKTARLTHSVFRVQEDPKAAQRACNVRYRRDVCFSQAVSTCVVLITFFLLYPHLYI